MTKSYQDEQDFIYNGPQNCKLAYALGETGFTALCNIIDSSPLFYADIDYEDDVDEDFMELEELRAELLGGEAAELVKDKQKKLAKAGKHLIGYKKTDIESALKVNKQDVFSAQSTQLTDVTAYLKKLESSKLGALLLAHAEKHGIEFKSTGQVYNVFYDRDGGQILINPKAGTTAIILGLAKSLRDTWKHKKGVMVHPLCFHPDDAVLLNRLHSADVQTVQCRVAWEMKLAGHENIWAELMGSVCYDLAGAYAKEAIADFRSLNNGQAAAACFETWFLSGRCKMTDKKLIQTMLADHNGMVFDHPESSRTASYEIISGLGEMPEGKNYLSGHIHQIAEDPLYAEVRDRSNANFLWFIKFERSFRDSEQSLQKESSPNSDVQSAFPISEDKRHESSRQNIISFKPLESAAEGHRPDAKRAAGAKAEEYATVYYLEHFKKPSQKMRSFE